MSSSVNMNSFLELFASDNVTHLIKHFYESLQFIFLSHLSEPTRNRLRNTILETPLQTPSKTPSKTPIRNPLGTPFKILLGTLLDRLLDKTT